MVKKQIYLVLPGHATQTALAIMTAVKKTTALQNVESSSFKVAPNKIMKVAENLKLRSGEATSNRVLAVMAASTKVKILELGKAETIDGISSS
ncbi:hypothetical protein [Treponema sp.]|uniref:hypothetical protein n=1 Tax=Treponema sp. TaxID=166 RepID=UPI003EFF8554